jgi:hypothetical protein
VSDAAISILQRQRASLQPLQHFARGVLHARRLFDSRHKGLRGSSLSLSLDLLLAAPAYSCIVSIPAFAAASSHNEAWPVVVLDGLQQQAAVVARTV